MSVAVDLPPQRGAGPDADQREAVLRPGFLETPDIGR